MKVVYSLKTGEYDPISYGTNYLYNQYDRIQSFLLKLNKSSYKSILAKPILGNGQVVWYADFTETFTRISEFDEHTQIEIKSKYWQSIQQIQHEILQLSQSRDIEKQNWANLLKEVFNEEDNVIISNGNDWCLLWGWRFRNKSENYLSPEFMPKVIPQSNMVLEETSDDYEMGTTTTNFDTDNISSLPEDPPKGEVNKANIPNVTKVKPSLWTRIKRALRTFVYRMWGLLLLIMFILFLSCLIKKCTNDRLSKSCNDSDQINQKLIDLDKKIQDRCQNK